MRKPTSTPNRAIYSWYGQQMEVDLVKCRAALLLKLVDLELKGKKSTIVAFADQLNIHPETLRRFRVGRPVGPTTFNVILAGLGLKAEDVMRPVA